MAVQIVSNTTEKILSKIIFRSKKYGRWLDITQVYLSKISKCVPRTVLNHINLLIDKGVLLKEKFNANDMDNRNFYAVNSKALEDSVVMDIFSALIVKTMRNI